MDLMGAVTVLAKILLGAAVALFIMNYVRFSRELKLLRESKTYLQESLLRATSAGRPIPPAGTPGISPGSIVPSVMPGTARPISFGMPAVQMGSSMFSFMDPKETRRWELFMAGNALRAAIWENLFAGVEHPDNWKSEQISIHITKYRALMEAFEESKDVFAWFNDNDAID